MGNLSGNQVTHETLGKTPEGRMFICPCLSLVATELQTLVLFLLFSAIPTCSSLNVSYKHNVMTFCQLYCPVLAGDLLKDDICFLSSCLICHIQ